MAGRERALIVGAGAGLSAAIARRCAGEGMEIVLAARNTQKLADLAREVGAAVVACDATSADQVHRLFAAIDAGGERLDLVVYNASARVRGYPRSSSFAMGKFALRGLAQSLARELQPHNIHVGHIVIDGGIAKAGDPRANERGPDGLLDPDAIADTYLQLHRQQRSAWAWEIELRPWVENF